MASDRPCLHWQRFRCSYGASCSFSHEGPGGPASSTGATPMGLAVQGLHAVGGAEPGFSAFSPRHQVVRAVHTQLPALEISSAPSPRKRVCSHWQQFKCSYGSTCSFSHDGPGGLSTEALHAEAALAPKQHSAPPAIAADGRLCLHWQQFRCSYGDTCSFSHDGPGGLSPRTQQQQQDMALAEAAAAAEAARTRPRKSICLHWQHCKCNYGDACSFSHMGPGGLSAEASRAQQEAAFAETAAAAALQNSSPQPGTRVCLHWQQFKCTYGAVCSFSHDGPGGLGGEAAKAEAQGKAAHAAQVAAECAAATSWAGFSKGGKTFMPQPPKDLPALSLDLGVKLEQDIQVATRPRTRLCTHWQQFKCNYGAACTFSHDGPGGPNPNGVHPVVALASAEAEAQAEAEIVAQIEEEAAIKNQAEPPKSTQLCNHWAQFRCTYGDACSFSHNGPGGHALPGVELVVGTDRREHEASTANQRGTICNHWRQYRCSYGVGCSFSHEGPGGLAPGLSSLQVLPVTTRGSGPARMSGSVGRLRPY